MSRVLAGLLGANEVPFRQQIQRLEQAAGLPSADIRLSAHVLQATRQKIRELGLDPTDTTGPELFSALQARLQQDEIRVRASLNLRADIHTVDMLERVADALTQLDHHSDVFVMKSTVVKQLLKKLKPKATMKRLGYRSMDSMLKHEPVAQLLAACQVTESPEWHEARLQAYRKLQTKDFESRRPHFIVPSGKQWPKLAEMHISKQRHHLIEVPELGAVVILPMEQDMPGLAVTTFALSLQALNSMRALSAYLKLQQVRPDFGDVVQDSILHEPLTEVELGGNKLSWRMIHWFYGQGHANYHPEVFEPHVQAEDLTWHHAGKELARLQPVLQFWEETEILGLLDGREAVSLNVLDVALGVCNKLVYGERVVHNMRESLGRELFARYMQQDYMQDMLGTTLSKQLAPEIEFE